MRAQGEQAGRGCQHWHCCPPACSCSCHCSGVLCWAALKQCGQAQAQAAGRSWGLERAQVHGRVRAGQGGERRLVGALDRLHWQGCPGGSSHSWLLPCWLLGSWHSCSRGGHCSSSTGKPLRLVVVRLAPALHGAAQGAQAGGTGGGRAQGGCKLSQAGGKKKMPPPSPPQCVFPSNF